MAIWLLTHSYNRGQDKNTPAKPAKGGTRFVNRFV
jgi:hypothetical protein